MTSLPTTTTTRLPAPSRPDGAMARPGAAGPTARSLTIGQIVSMLVRHIWLILAIFVVVQLITWGLFAASHKWFKEVHRPRLDEAGRAAQPL